MRRSSELIRYARQRACSNRSIAFVAAIVFGFSVSGYAQPPGTKRASQTDENPQVHLAGEVQLARLVDLCAERLGLNIQYDASALTAKVTLRLKGPLTDEELWSLTNRLLGLNGLTSVELAGGPEEGKAGKTLSIVKLAEAGGLSRVIQHDGADRADESLAGFSTIVVRLRYQSATTVLDALQPVMNRQGSTAA